CPWSTSGSRYPRLRRHRVSSPHAHPPLEEGRPTGAAQYMPENNPKNARARRVLPGRRPHPALDFPPIDEAQQQGRFDPVVFGVAAAFTIAFLVWGALNTDGLAAWSGSALIWTMKYTGWLFILASSGFVVFVLWLALGKFGNIPLGR